MGTPKSWNAQQAASSLVFRQVPVLESEITLLPLAPGSLPIKVHVDTLFVFLGNGLWLGMSLEPRLVLGVESP